MTQRVTILGKRFAALRRDRYLTQEEFAERLQMSPANVRRLEQAEVSGMQARNFRRLATLINVSPDELREQIGSIAAPAPPQSARTFEMRDGSSVPGLVAPPRRNRKRQKFSGSQYDDEADLSSLSKGDRSTRDPASPAQAGDADLPPGLRAAAAREVVEVPHYHGVSAARVEQRTDIHRGRATVPAGTMRRFAVTVDGDCMEPRYHDGDVVVFSIDAAEKEGIVEGKNYFLQLADGENTFKRIFFDLDSRETLILRCWNARYPDRTIDRASVKILARAVYRLTPDE